MTELGMTTKLITESGWKYALLAILIFILLGMDVLSVFFGMLVDGRPMSEFGISNKHWYATVSTFLCSICLWTIAASLIVRWTKRCGVLDVFLSRTTGRKVLLVGFVGVIILILISWLESHTMSLSLVSEYHGFAQRNPGYGVLLTSFQYLYYFLESIMVVLMLAAWQRAGEIWTGQTKIPWGGLGLTLTWGLAHYASHPQGALTVVLSAFVFGCVFVGVQKNAIVTLLVVYSVFVL